MRALLSPPVEASLPCGAPRAHAIVPLRGTSLTRDLERLGESRIAESIRGMDSIYAETDAAQAAWKLASPFHCAEGCGSCCVGFEPDVLESEALYLAWHLLSSGDPRSSSLLDGSYVSPRSDPEAGCPFFDPSNPYHCTVYEGRTLICRLFAYTGDRGKDGSIRWKPCKFLPLEGLDGGLQRRSQYAERELRERFGALPPVMSDITAQAVALDPDGAHSRLPLREALPRALAKILMVLRFTNGSPEPESPDPDIPRPLAS